MNNQRNVAHVILDIAKIKDIEALPLGVYIYKEMDMFVLRDTTIEGELNELTMWDALEVYEEQVDPLLEKLEIVKAALVIEQQDMKKHMEAIPGRLQAIYNYKMDVDALERTIELMKEVD